MRIECCRFDLFADKIIHYGKKIALFGAGAIGTVIAPEILCKYGLLEKIDCYIDNDEKKWGQQIWVLDRYIEIRSPNYLEKNIQSMVIILNISRYSEVLNQIDKMIESDDVFCYIFPMMLIHNYCSIETKRLDTGTNVPLIPKKLHYMWFGGGSIPDKLKRCRESWEKYCPNFEIVEWNESNYDIEKHLYMKQAYETGAYGFIPDYARLDILYNQGGIYLDTDVEIIRPIDDLLCQEAFCGVEKWQIINFGGLSGAVKGHPMIRKFLEGRRDLSFINDDGTQNRNTCGFYDTRIALEEGYSINGYSQSIKGLNVYAYDYFHPYDYMSGILNKTANTYSIHWFNGGWLDSHMKKINEETQKKYFELYNMALQAI